jgi:hypothetical protein
MPKLPIKSGNETLEIQEFVDGDERVVKVDDRFYAVWAIPGSDRFYFMIKVGKHGRSIQGTHDQLVEMLTRVHRIYRDYENRVSNSKDAAQRERDRLLNELAEKNLTARDLSSKAK